VRKLALLLMIFTLLATPAYTQEDDEDQPFTIGMILVGPRDDRGWSQAHYEGGLYVAENFDAQLLVYENYNETTSDERSMSQIVDDFVAQGAQLIFLTSDEFQAEAEEVARLHPSVAFVHISGDSVLTGSAPDNLGNVMAQMEWGKMLSGCAAAMKTQTGRIGYLGPLINAETRRLAASAYLGASHCYETYRDDITEPLEFEVQWVGFWFFIDGVTEDPVALTEAMVENGADVILSGIDTPEALEVTNALHADGETVYATSYNASSACDEFDEICLGTAYYFWGPTYLQIARSVANGEWEPTWEWLEPNSLYSTRAVVGFDIAPAFDLTENNELQDFRGDLTGYTNNDLIPPSFPLWRGPLELQDGTLLAEDGEIVTLLEIWYLPQLLAGMEGASTP